MNFIENIPVTVEDIDMATKICGPNIGMLKGKTVKKEYPRAKRDYINLPEEMSANSMAKITLTIDAMSVNGSLFLTTISLNLYYHSTHFVQKKQ